MAGPLSSISASCNPETLIAADEGVTTMLCKRAALAVFSCLALLSLPVMPAVADGSHPVSRFKDWSSLGLLWRRTTPSASNVSAASPTCTFDSASGTLTVSAAGQTLLWVPADGGGVVYLDSVPCPDNPTINDIELITVVGTTFSEILIIDFSGQTFAPGRTAEASGTSEIEFSIDLGTGIDVLAIGGTSAADAIELGTLGVNMNADDDADITFSGVEQTEIFAFDGPDSINAQGGTSTGEVFQSQTPTAASTLIVLGENGNDVMTGGVGPSVVAFINSANGVRVDMPTGTATGEGSDTFSFIGSAIGSPRNDEVIGDSQANFLAGSTGSDVVVGASGNDIISGEGGNDLLRPGPGSDEVEGNAGSDTLSYQFASARVAVNLSQGSASGEGPDEIAGIEDVIGSRFSDRLTGNGANNVIRGLGGGDEISGLSGGDALIGAGGGDVITGGSGGDLLQGELDADVVRGGPDADTMNGGPGRDVVAGQGGRDRVLGSNGPDKLSGGGGRDVLKGGGKDDRLEGGADADKLFGEGGSDKLFGGGGGDVIEAGVGGDVLRGEAGADTLRGGDGNDTLYGGDGNDGLFGGSGTDTCYQNAGSGTKSSCELPKPPPPSGGGGDGGQPNCDPSYPDFCIPPPPPDLDCADVNGTNFTVVGDDPHGFDSDNDGVGCES
jgi:Ca2+-binding RTX toxin-like protein